MPRRWSQRPGDWSRKLQWEATLDGIADDGSITPELALRAFSIAYGPLPGVELPRKRLGTPESATLAMQLVARVWDQIGAEQRVAIEAALGAPHDSSSPPLASASAQVLTPDPTYQALVDKYIAFYRARIPGVPPLPVRVYKASEEITDAAGTKAWADAQPKNAAGEWGAGTPAYCEVRVPPAGQSQAGGPFLELVLAHEAFHCIQGALMTAWRTRSAWIIEGSADWAAVTAFPVSVAVGAGPYKYYLQTPNAPLFSRSYAASGFWARVDEVAGAGSLWANLPAILNAPTDPGSFSAAGADFSGFVQTWASSMWRLPVAPDAWKQQKPWFIPGPVQPLPVAPIATSTDINAAPYVTRGYKVTVDPNLPLVELQGLTGSLRTGVGDTDYGPVGASEHYCLIGKCKCPPKSTGTLPFNVPVSPGYLNLGLTGGAAAAAARVIYHSLDEYCKKKKDKGKGPSGPAESNGDPHLTTFDGLHYDFQGAGEFVLARSSAGDLEIQAREEPYEDSKTVTVNTQVAIGIDGHRVTVSPETAQSGQPVLRIDGSEFDLAQGASASLGGGTVMREIQSGTIQVHWADGSFAEVRSVGRWGVATNIELAGARRGTVSGLLGNFDDNVGNELATRQGRQIRYSTKETPGWSGLTRYYVKQEFGGRFFDDLYDVVGDSWRITQAESLLDYEPGQTTQTFTNRRIPSKPVDPDELARRRRAEAERACRAAGVTDAGPLADCIVDMAATGNPAFAEDAAIAQEAARASWSKLAAGERRVSDLSLLQAGDGTLHLAFEERLDGPSYQMLNVPISAAGAEGPAEVINTRDQEPSLFAGPDGEVRSASGELPEAETSGIYQYVRSAAGTWTRVAAPVATGGFTYAGVSDSLFADGTQFTIAPMAGVSRLFRGSGNAGVDLVSEESGCYATSASFARDGATGALWVAWLQWDCPVEGVFAQEVDQATGQLIGSPLKAPGSTWESSGAQRTVDINLNESLAFNGRPGQPGVQLAYAVDDNTRTLLWRVGEETAQAVPQRREAIDDVFLTADPEGGKAWLGWEEGRRLWLQRISAAGTPEGKQLPLDPPRGSNAPLLSFHNWNIAARAGALDVIFGYRYDSETQGGLWRARVPAG